MLWMKENGSGNHVDDGNFEDELSWPWFGKCASDDPDIRSFAK